MASELPSIQSELLKIPGMSPLFMTQFGQLFLEITKKYSALKFQAYSSHSGTAPEAVRGAPSGSNTNARKENDEPKKKKTRRKDSAETKQGPTTRARANGKNKSNKSN